jgi:hypothetical protein
MSLAAFLISSCSVFPKLLVETFVKSSRITILNLPIATLSRNIKFKNHNDKSMVTTKINATRTKLTTTATIITTLSTEKK